MAASRDVASHALRASLLAMLAATAQAAPVAQPSRSVVEFGFISPGIASPPQPVFVTNTGDAPLAISALAKSGPQADDFALGGTCSVPASLAPAARCRIEIVMTPTGQRGRTTSATLTIESNGAERAFASPAHCRASATSSGRTASVSTGMNFAERPSAVTLAPSCSNTETNRSRPTVECWYTPTDVPSRALGPNNETKRALYSRSTSWAGVK